MKNFLREVLITVLLAIVIFLIARSAIQTYEVLQTSMEPNFYEGQRVVVNKAVYWDWISEPERGDVVILHAPNGTDDEFIKRIIGLPGDTVEVINGKVYINGHVLEEPYVIRSFTYTMAEQEIPPDYYFVLGDNRDISNDSHSGWLMPRENLVGKAWLITWPPGNWGIVPNYPLEKQLDNTEAQSDNLNWRMIAARE